MVKSEQALNDNRGNKMKEDILPEAEKFSPILIEEYIRQMSAAHYIQAEDKTMPVLFLINPDIYQQVLDCPIKAPLIGLSLDYNSSSKKLTVIANEDFIKMYENKIQAEVALNFAKVNTQRYAKWIKISE